MESKSAISWVSSIAYSEPYSKLKNFLYKILLPTKAIGKNLTNDINSTSLSPNIFVYTLLLCGENKMGVYTPIHVYINY